MVIKYPHEKVWTNYYMMDLEKDIAFEIGRFYYGIRDYTNALWYYCESTRTIGYVHMHACICFTYEKLY